ncbi:MAG: 1-acyl-sn-glycerol-3-phosphate acyltransferase, partial [Actinomycetota bacterium]|nr:1-acyl-sn-glycerol-3-phosphate acyltransferase [Actinomycetota bacterium]
AGVRIALAYLAEGWALGIFPEGTHKDDGTAREAKSGAVMLAIRGGAPVLPVFVGKIPGPLARLRGGRLRLIVGDPIHLDENLRGGKAYREAADEVLQTIYALPEEERP